MHLEFRVFGKKNRKKLIKKTTLMNRNHKFFRYDANPFLMERESYIFLFAHVTLWCIRVCMFVDMNEFTALAWPGWHGLIYYEICMFHRIFDHIDDMALKLKGQACVDRCWCYGCHRIVNIPVEIKTMLMSKRWKKGSLLFVSMQYKTIYWLVAGNNITLRNGSIVMRFAVVHPSPNSYLTT